MYPNLYFVESWIKELIAEGNGLIYERPQKTEVDALGECYIIYGELTQFQNELFLEGYTAKAISVLKKLDLYRDSTMLNNLKNELRDGQFDNNKTHALNKHVAKVLGSLTELGESGLDFNSF